jgi:hypothetical protein
MFNTRSGFTVDPVTYPQLSQFVAATANRVFTHGQFSGMTVRSVALRLTAPSKEYLEGEVCGELEFSEANLDAFMLNFGSCQQIELRAKEFERPPMRIPRKLPGRENKSESSDESGAARAVGERNRTLTLTGAEAPQDLEKYDYVVTYRHHRQSGSSFRSTSGASRTSGSSPGASPLSVISDYYELATPDDVSPRGTRRPQRFFDDGTYVLETPDDIAPPLPPKPHKKAPLRKVKTAPALIPPKSEKLPKKLTPYVTMYSSAQPHQLISDAHDYEDPDYEEMDQWRPIARKRL